MQRIDRNYFLERKYKPISLLGEGGMGAVYLAEDLSKGCRVAIKILFLNSVEAEKAQRRFFAEMEMFKKVQHENVVRSFENFKEKNFHAFIMEYVDGGNLNDKMRNGLIRKEQAVDYLKQLASGLNALHQAGIVHRDIKPENILLTADGKIKISDLGLARHDSSSTLTNVGMIVGTPQYLSPEYIELGECDHRADIFALGVIAYEMIANRSPWGTSSGMKLLAERANRKVTDLYELKIGCSPDIARIVDKAMSINLGARYQSAAEILEDLGV